MRSLTKRIVNVWEKKEKWSQGKSTIASLLKQPDHINYRSEQQASNIKVNNVDSENGVCIRTNTIWRRKSIHQLMLSFERLIFFTNDHGHSQLHHICLNLPSHRMYSNDLIDDAFDHHNYMFVYIHLYLSMESVRQEIWSLWSFLLYILFSFFFIFSHRERICKLQHHHHHYHYHQAERRKKDRKRAYLCIDLHISLFVYIYSDRWLNFDKIQLSFFLSFTV